MGDLTQSISMTINDDFLAFALQTTFMQYDADRSGTVEPHELHAALAAFGKILCILVSLKSKLP